MTDLRLAVVLPDGTPGDTRGTLRLDGGTIRADGSAAAGLLETLRRHSRMSDPEIWQWLRREGWSNGHLMLAE